MDASATLLPRIRAAAERAGITPTIVITKHAGHAREVALACGNEAEPARLYACGGDGTMNEVLQGAAGRPQLSVGCIPCGSGNDYVRNFGTQSDFLDLDAQLAALSCPVDLILTPQGVRNRYLCRGNRRPGCQRDPQMAARTTMRRCHRLYLIHPGGRLQFFSTQTSCYR